MNETAGTCLAIKEKKAHRPGGCVGIFFQLFDWNRRFAKKKLFSKKLIPPARSNHGSKKFGGDEKMPKTKLHLIADENKGGFPNLKKNGDSNGDMVVQKHEMRAPGLVARLMGLESLPAAHRHKHKKVSNAVSCDVGEEKFLNSCRSEPDKDDAKMEKGGTKVESRPQKLQKTGQFERRAVTRFGAEALQIKGVLSRSRKHHHPKLSPPVKSPRISASKNASRASRLIDAATRILEPGLQATNRAKSALTYSSPTNYHPRDGVLTEDVGVLLPNTAKRDNGGCNVDAGKPSIEHTSCKNCGNLLDVVDSRPNLEDHPFVRPSTASAYIPFQGSEVIRPPISSPENERNVIHRRIWNQQSNEKEEQDNALLPSETITIIKPLCQEGQLERQLRGHQWMPENDESSSTTFKQRIQAQNEMSVGRDITPPRATLNDLQSRRASSAANAISRATDFVALNRNIISRGRPRASTVSDNAAFGKERKFCSKRDDSSSPLRSPVRKRRTVSANAVENTGFANSVAVRERNAKYNAVHRKEVATSSRSLDCACTRNRSVSHGECNKADGNRGNDVISFTFNSPLRHKTLVSPGLKESNHIDKNTSHQRKLVLDENESKASLQKQLPLRGDALGTILEQKLKELVSQEEDELTSGASHPKRSTAMILQDLIFALTAEQPISPNDHMFNTVKTYQKERKIGGASIGISHDGDHLSPGSVLEACFSNESCLSSSLDDSSGRRLFPDSIDYSYELQQTMEADADLLDCAASLNQGRTAGKMATDLLNHISRILQSINLAGGGLTGNKLTHTKEVILNAELLFGNATRQNSDKTKRFLIGPFLLDGLETLAGAMWTNLNCLLGFEENKDGGHQLRRFLFDCVIECLDSEYGQCCNSGFKAWKRVPSCMNVDVLIGEIDKEVRRWTNFSGMIPDEIIDWEMSHSLGKWMDFEVESFETGAEISREILQVLVEEIALDLLECRVGSLLRCN